MDQVSCSVGPSGDVELSRTAEAEASVRRIVYTLLICVTVFGVVGRLLAVDAASLSANDRSRWATVRSLVDEGTYAVGKREQRTDGKVRDSGITTERGWQTIDLVLNPDTQTFYSSKPPLLPTATAGVYWMLKNTIGWSILTERWRVYWVTLLIVNCVPLTIYLILLTRLIEELGRSHWGRLYVATAACFGTFLTTFAIVLNNHVPAACCVLFAVYQIIRLQLNPLDMREPQPNEPTGAGRCTHFRAALAGFFAGCAAANDLPAAALLVWLWVSLAQKFRGATLFWFVAAAALPIAAFLLTNYLAIDRLTPAYGEFGGPWYEFEGSYWGDTSRDGIDGAGALENKFDYLFHMLFGHHGLFSLTPIFLLIFFGGKWARHGRTQGASEPRRGCSVVAVDGNSRAHCDRRRLLSVQDEQLRRVHVRPAVAVLANTAALTRVAARCRCLERQSCETASLLRAARGGSPVNQLLRHTAVVAPLALQLDGVTGDD